MLRQEAAGKYQPSRRCEVGSQRPENVDMLVIPGWKNTHCTVNDATNLEYGDARRGLVVDLLLPKLGAVSLHCFPTNRRNNFESRNQLFPLGRVMEYVEKDDRDLDEHIFLSAVWC